LRPLRWLAWALLSLGSGEDAGRLIAGPSTDLGWSRLSCWSRGFLCKGRQLAFAPTENQVERFREVSEPLIAAIGEALDDATEYGNARRGYAACALTDVLHAQFELALARFKAGELDYANEVEDVLRKVPEQRRQISELEDR
jgi:hypothetical protein